MQGTLGDLGPGLGLTPTEANASRSVFRPVCTFLAPEAWPGAGTPKGARERHRPPQPGSYGLHALPSCSHRKAKRRVLTAGGGVTPRGHVAMPGGMMSCQEHGAGCAPASESAADSAPRPPPHRAQHGPAPRGDRARRQHCCLCPGGKRPRSMQHRAASTLRPVDVRGSCGHSQALPAPGPSAEGGRPGPACGQPIDQTRLQSDVCFVTSPRARASSLTRGSGARSCRSPSITSVPPSNGPGTALALQMLLRDLSERQAFWACFSE